MQKKAPAKRIPTSKPRKVATGETMKFTIESDEEAAGQDKKKKRVRTTTAKVLGKPSMRRDSEEEEEEEEDAAPAPKAQKLMGDAIKAGAAPSKPKAAPKAAAPTPILNPRGTQEVYLHQRRTRPQCLKLLKKKVILLFGESLSPRFLITMMLIQLLKTCI